MNTPRSYRHLRIKRSSTASTPGTTTPETSAKSGPVIDTVGHTALVPVTKVGSPRPPESETPEAEDSETEEDTAVEETPAEESAVKAVPEVEEVAEPEVTGASTALSTADPVEPAPSDSSIERAHQLTVTNQDVPDPTPAVTSTKSMVTTELVSGLRTASRHLSRPSASEGHLRTELTITARRIDSLVLANDAHHQSWAIAAMALVHDAGCALDQRRITDGWQLLRAAQTEMLDGLDHRSLAVERANIAGTELVIDDNADVDRLRSEVWAMRQTKNTYRAELERRLFEAARGLFHRAVTLIGVLVLGAIGVILAAPSSTEGDALGGITAYLTIVGLGMTGAAVSHVLFTNDSQRASAISEVANPLQIVLLRLAFGGVAGLLVVVLLQADIQNLINVTAISAYPWAILGGFAERYVDRVIDHVEADAHTAATEACREGIA